MTMMKWLIAMAIGGLVMWWLLQDRFDRPHVERSTLTIEHVQQLAALTTTRITIRDIVTTSIEGYTGSLRIALLVKGDCLVSVDLARARFIERDVDTRCAVLVLPPPGVLSARLDHEQTLVFDIVASGLWQLLPTDTRRPDLVNAAMRKAQQRIEQAANDGDLLQRERQRIEQLIGSSLEHAFGWTVIVQWEDEEGADAQAGE